MSSEWGSVRLDEVADLSGGYAFKSDEYTETGCFVLRTVNITDSGRISKDGATYVSEDAVAGYERFLLKPNDTLFVMVGATLGKIGIVKDADLPALLNQNMWLVRAKQGEVDSLFLHYAFSHYSLGLIGFASGSARGFLRREDFRKMNLMVPSMKEQKEIGNFLGAIDDRIALLKETNATLEAIAQAFFKSWFVDFDPVRAKAEGRPPEGMAAATAALFPDSFEDSEVGCIPKGWAVKAFTACVDVVGGGTPKTSIPEYWDGEIPWFSVVDAPVPSDVFVIDTEKHISEAALRGSSTKLLKRGTTIISARGTVGRLALVGREMAMNQSCYGLVGKAGDAYFTYFSTYRLVSALQQRTHGSVFDTITRDTLSGVNVIYPGVDIICAFEGLLSPIMERIKSNIELSDTLCRIRDGLLPRLISGQLRLPEAEEQVQEAMA